MSNLKIYFKNYNLLCQSLYDLKGALYLILTVYLTNQEKRVIHFVTLMFMFCFFPVIIINTESKVVLIHLLQAMALVPVVFFFLLLLLLSSSTLLVLLLLVAVEVQYHLHIMCCSSSNSSNSSRNSSTISMTILILHV